MMKTGQNTVHRAVEGAALEMDITMTTARCRRIRWAVRKGLETGRQQRIGRGKERQLRTGRGKRRGMGMETVERKELFNTPQGEMISLVPLLCSCKRQCQRQTWTRRAN